MQIEIDQAKLDQMVSAAILDGMSAEKRDELIRSAVASLLSVPRDSYNRKSPIKDAFDQAVQRTAANFIEEHLAKDQVFIGTIKAMVLEAVERTLDQSKREQVVTKMADGLTAWLTRDRY